MQEEKPKNKFYQFFKTTLIGGFVVVLPLSIVVFIFKWMFGIISDMIEPITSRIIADTQYYSEFVDFLVVLTLIFACFFIGLFVKTKIGLWLYSVLERKLFSRIPGYKMVKETISQLLSQNRSSPFSSVALCRIFGNDTMVTAFITDKHENGSFTVFVPTGPNPTSGNIYHLKAEYVHIIKASTEETMRSIISCGAGSQVLIKEYEKLNAIKLEKTSKESSIEEKAADKKADSST